MGDNRDFFALVLFEAIFQKTSDAAAKRIDRFAALWRFPFSAGPGKEAFVLLQNKLIRSFSFPAAEV